MQSFREYYTKEAVSMATRMKMKASMRKNKAKIAIGRKKAMKRLASPEKLHKKSNKAARNLILKKILKDRDKSTLSYAARADIEKKLDKKKNAIKRLAKKLLPSIKKADRAKLKSKKG